MTATVLSLIFEEVHRVAAGEVPVLNEDVYTTLLTSSLEDECSKLSGTAIFDAAEAVESVNEVSRSAASCGPSDPSRFSATSPLVPRLSTRDTAHESHFSSSTRSARRREVVQESRSAAERSLTPRNVSSKGTRGTNGQAHSSQHSQRITPQGILSMALMAGESLLMGDYSAILAHNRRCRRKLCMSSSVNLHKPKVEDPRTLESLLEELPPPRSSLSINANTGTRPCSTQALRRHLNEVIFALTSASETKPLHLTSGITALVCLPYQFGQQTELEVSLKPLCIEALSSGQVSLRKFHREFCDLYLTRLRAHAKLIWQRVSLAQEECLNEATESIGQLLKALNDYLSLVPLVGHDGFAAVVEVLVYSRMGLVITSEASSHPDSNQALGMNAWICVASAIVSKATKCDDILVINMLMSVLLRQETTYLWVCSYAESLLFPCDVDLCYDEHSRNNTVLSGQQNDMCCNLLNYFSTLVRLIDTWRIHENVTNSHACCDSLCHRQDSCSLQVCRAHLDFLTHPQTGILCRVLGRSYLRRLPVQVRKAALTVAESVISSSSCLICIDMDFACNLAHACFISFLRLYNTETTKHRNKLPEGWSELVTGHLRVLKAVITLDVSTRKTSASILKRNSAYPIIVHRTSGTRCQENVNPALCENAKLVVVAKILRRMRVFDFFLREISLEHEVSHKIFAGYQNSADFQVLKGSPAINCCHDSAPTPLAPDENTRTGIFEESFVPAAKPVIPKLKLGKVNNAQRNVASTTISHDLIAGNEDAESHTHRQHDRGKYTGDLLEDVEREEANELRAHLSDSGSEFPPCGALKPISSRLETSESDTCCLSHDDHKSRSELHRKASTRSAKLGGEESVSSRKTPMLVFSETRESIGSSQDVGMRTTDLLFPKVENDGGIEHSESEKAVLLERHFRRMYSDVHVQSTIIELLLCLIAETTIHRQRDDMAEVSDGLPSIISRLHETCHRLDNCRNHFLFILRAHLKYIHNFPIIPILASTAVRLGRDAERLFRLSCDVLFLPKRYSSRKLVARGGYAQVYRCALPHELGTLASTEVALKIVDAPQSVHDPASASAVYSEIAMFEAMDCEPLTAKLLDFGVAGDGFYMVLQDYPASLKQWRTAQSKFTESETTSSRLALYLNIYSQCINAVSALEKYNVVHFDIKADNFLLDPAPDCTLQNFWDPPKHCSTPPFQVLITDFGESRMYVSTRTAATAQGRGTEYVKAPEMLSMTNAAKKCTKEYDRRKHHKCGRPSDVWALGCLLYEILTNALLLYDDDWIRFFLRTVTRETELLPPKSLAVLETLPEIKMFILWVLERDPNRRPTLSDVKTEFEVVRRKLSHDLSSLSKRWGSANQNRFTGLWALGTGSPAAFEMRCLTDSNTSTHPEPVSLFDFFPASPQITSDAPSGETGASLLMGWEIPYEEMVPVFNASTELNTIYFCDVVSLLDRNLSDSNIAGIIICEHEADKGLVDTSCHPVLGRVQSHAGVSVSLSQLSQLADAAGIQSCTVSLPSVLCHDSEAISVFSAQINRAIRFIYRHQNSTKFSSDLLSPSENVLCRSGVRFLVASFTNDVTSALALSAALHIASNEGSLRAATLSFSTAMMCAAGLQPLHPTDAARLSAWEARVRADTAARNGCLWVRCQAGCWSVALDVSFDEAKNPDGLSWSESYGTSVMSEDRVEIGCASSAIRRCMSSHNAHRILGVDSLWVYTAAQNIFPGPFCAAAIPADSTGIEPCPDGPAIGEVASSGKIDTSEEDEWELFVCSTCGSPTHAVKKKDFGPTRRVALRVNSFSSTKGMGA